MFGRKEKICSVMTYKKNDIGEKIPVCLHSGHKRSLYYEIFDSETIKRLAEKDSTIKGNYFVTIDGIEFKLL